MTPRLLFLILLVCTSNASNEAGSDMLMSEASVKEMEKVFSRSEEAHAQSMAAIMTSMSPEKAWHVLEKHNLTTPALVQVAGDLLGKGKHLRTAPKGYAGLDGARKMLNDMIFESMSKYDQEIAKCTEYYYAQCSAMEGCRGQISASNFIAANSRTLILDAQARINRCEVDIPTRKLELKLHNEKCEAELKKMNARLTVILGDIEIMTVILKMTDCDAKSFMQMRKMAVLRCEDRCTKKSFITFNQDALRQKIAQLQSKTSNKLVQETFADLFEGAESIESVEFLQLNTHVEPVINKTSFNNPPTPRTEVPMNPCTDPNAGAPSQDTKDKGQNKCSLGKGNCYKLQERFLLIQAGIKDDRDALMEDIADMNKHCDETRTTLETQIKNDEAMLEEAQTKLAAATEKEATAGETARQTAIEHAQLDLDLQQQMKRCSGNYLNFESELCALKKIRGELMKMKGDGHSGFFQDCEVSKWDPEQCTKKCFQKGRPEGEQKLTRNVLTHPNGGAKCLPLAAMRKCNLHPCPVDCKVGAWSGWSKCSAECGGGERQRVREVKRAMKYGGDPCGKTTDAEQCNPQACEKDCELSAWTKWSWCSKDCDGGTRKRMKFVKMPAEGAGHCPDQWHEKRLQYRECNMHRCKVDPGEEVMKCNAKLDIVFLLDGSGSLGQKGWDAEIVMAEKFVDAFSGAGEGNGGCPKEFPFPSSVHDNKLCYTTEVLATAGAGACNEWCTLDVTKGSGCGDNEAKKCGPHAQMSVILFSGPRTWSGVYKCFAKNDEPVDMENTCKIKKVNDFSPNMQEVKNKIKALVWPKGSTLTSLALLTAKSELSLGRKDAKSVIVVITDGRPMSYRGTLIASKIVRKAARLVWVPVTKYAPLKYIKGWATRRWEENVVVVNEFQELETPDPVNHIIADICPKHEFGWGGMFKYEQ